MNAPEPDTWPEANQRYLSATLGVTRELLERHASRRAGDDVPTASESTACQELAEAEQQLPAPAALDTLAGAFALSPFERHILVLCAAVELDASFAALCAAAQGDPRRSYPTFSLALAALPDAHWSALTPARPLRRWRLIEVTTSDGLLAGPLRIDERVLHHLAGVDYVDERLQGLVEPLRAPETLPPSHREAVQRVIDLWSDNDPLRPAVLLCGSDDAGKRAVAGAACTALGLNGHVLRAADVPSTPTEREALARLWEREAVLSHGALLLDCDDTEDVRSALAFADGVAGALLISSREALRGRRRPLVRVDVPRPAPNEQEALWREVLGPAGSALNGQMRAAADQFRLGLQGVRAVGAAVRSRLATRDDVESDAVFWDACRAQARPRLDELARRIPPAAGWSDLVLPELQTRMLRELAAQVHHRSRVYEIWGFAAKGERGLGITALFAGPSGTGKTLAAEVLAAELRLDLYRIDLSQVVSKYIGETERNLRRVFDAAEEGGAVLLFDEADALFGKRSEVKDSHDRYANIEVSYLLQRMEAYRGLAILTTNLKSALDTAFLRRLRFVVAFPFPDAGLRTEIWRRIFPAAVPTEGLDFTRLARLDVAGGNIRNIALGAAFLAADADEPVRMAHLLRAARAEYAKLEKPLAEADVGGWS